MKREEASHNHLYIPSILLLLPCLPQHLMHHLAEVPNYPYGYSTSHPFQLHC
jgi:hypothetical protein